MEDEFQNPLDRLDAELKHEREEMVEVSEAYAERTLDLLSHLTQTVEPDGGVDARFDYRRVEAMARVVELRMNVLKNGIAHYSNEHKE